MKRVLLLFLGVAVAVGLAAYFVPAPAATVAGGPVSRRSLDQDLSAIAASTQFQCYLSEQDSLSAGRAVAVHVQGVASGSAGTATYATRFVDSWLGRMVAAKAAGQVLARQGATVTAGDLQVGRSVLERRITAVLDTYAQDAGTTPGCGGSGKAVLASVSPAFAAEQVRGQTEQALLEARAVGAGIVGSQVSAYFAAHRQEFDKVCLSVIVTSTKTKAVAADKAIKGGAAFAQEAKKSSIDSTTAANGGTAGCGVLAGTALYQPLAQLPLDKVSTPIAYNGSYIVAEVTSRTPVSFTTVAGTVLTVLLLAGQHKADAQVSSVVRSGGVTVDARFGHVKAGSSLVVPPRHPPLSSLLSARANTPAGG